MTRGCVLAARAEVAREPIRRAVGLIGRRGWSGSDGLVLDRCNGVHTCFMRFPIDVVLCDRDGRVLRVAESVRPWRAGPMAWGAESVVELPSGTAARTGTVPGDRLELMNSTA